MLKLIFDVNITKVVSNKKKYFFVFIGIIII